MSKVLKITKADKTTHIVPVTNKAFYQAQNNRLPADKKMKIEEISEDEARKVPFIDNDHITGSEAVVKNLELQKSLEDKDAEIAALKAKLAGVSAPTPPKATATEVIELINAATSVDQVEALVAADDRKTVKDAADKKIAALKA
jgi:Na+-translocating ferredoxin:NAD+ oxidoreductase RNF subunit RnfB